MFSVLLTIRDVLIFSVLRLVCCTSGAKVVVQCGYRYWYVCSTVGLEFHLLSIMASVVGRLKALN